MVGAEDRQIGVGCLVAYGLWVCAVTLMLFSWLVWDDLLAVHLARTSLLLTGAAVTATVRMFYVSHNRIVRSVLAVRDSVEEPLRSVR